MKIRFFLLGTCLLLCILPFIANAQCANETERLKFINAVRVSCPTCVDINNQIIADKAASVTSLYIRNKNLTCMVELDKFIALDRLDCMNNQLTSLPDLSNCKALTDVNCANNQLTSLTDFSNNLKLQYLDCKNNKLTTLPTLSQNTLLLNLSCEFNQLTSLPDLSANTKLRGLYCQNNQLTTIPDMLNSKDLNSFYCFNNQLTSIPDLSNNTGLLNLHVSDNKLTSIPDLSNLPNLHVFSTQNNPLCTIGRLPNSISNLTINNAVDCLPNIPDGLTYLDGKFLSASQGLLQYPDCKNFPNAISKIGFNLDASICIGQQVIFTNTTSPITRTNFDWDFGDGTKSMLTNPLHHYDKAGQYNVTLRAGSCAGSTSLSKTVIVKPAIMPIITYSTVVCPNDESEFFTNAICNQYSWVVNGGTIISGDGTSKIKVLWSDGQNGNGKVSLAATKCGKGYCEIPVTIEVPIVPTQVSIQGVIKPCQNQEETYLVNPKDESPGTIYTWVVTGGTVIDSKISDYRLTSIRVKWETGPNGKITLTTTNELLTKCPGKAELIIDIKPKFKIYGTKTSCENLVNNYNIYAQGSFKWSVDGANSINATGKVNWGNTAGIYKVIAQVENQGVYCSTSDTIKVMLAANPVISAVNGSIDVDVNSTQLYEALVDSSNTQISWTPIDGYVKNNFGKSATIEWGSSGNYTLEAIARDNKTGCTSFPYKLNIKSNFVFEITGSDKVCITDKFAYSATLDVAHPVSYQWKTNGGVIAESPALSISNMTFIAPGLQQVELTAIRNNKTYNVTKVVLVEAAPTQLQLTGPVNIEQTATGTFNYIVANPDNLSFVTTVTGSKSYNIVGNDILVVWGTTGPFQIQIVGIVAGYNCPGVPVELTIQRVPDLQKKIGASATSCLNSEITYSFNPDRFVQNPVWKLSGGGTITEQTQSTLKVLWGNTPGNYLISLEYERFGNQKVTLPINLAALPAPQINSVTICGNTATTLSVTQVYSDYKWTLEGTVGFISTNSTASVSAEGMYKVKVKDQFDCFGTGNRYIQQSPLPQADIFSDGATGFCLDSNVTSAVVTLSALEGVDYIYQWFNGNVPIANATQSVFPVTVALNVTSNIDYSVKVVKNGCSVHSATKTIVVSVCNPGTGGNTCTDPIPRFNTSATCQPILFSTNSTGPFTWNFDDGTTASTTSVSKNFSKAGFFNVSLSKGCASSSQNLEISAHANFKLASPSCENQITSFKEFSTNIPTAQIVSWIWDFGDNTPPQLNSGRGIRDAQHVFTQSGTYTVSLTLKAKSSSGVQCDFTAIMPIKITTLPQAGFSFVNPSCTDSIYKFNLVTNTPSSSFLWDFGNNTSSTNSVPQIKYSSAGTYLVKLVVTDLLSCEQTTTQSIDIVDPVPVGKIVVSGKTLLCNGASATLTPPAGINYSWKKNGQPIGNSNSSILVSNAGKYSVTYQNGTCSVATDAVEIIEYNLTETLVGSENTCLGESIILDTKLPSENYSFAWTKDQQLLLSASSKLEVNKITNADSGTYQVQTTNKENGCIFALPSKVIKVNAKPAKPLLKADKELVCYNELIYLTGSGNLVGKAYSWYKTDQLLSEKSPQLILQNSKVSDGGDYRFIVTDLATTCSNSSDIEIIKVTRPISNLITGNPDVCLGSKSEYSSDLDPNLYDFKWYKNNFAFGLSATTKITFSKVTASDAGTYHLLVTTKDTLVNGNCSSKSNAINVVVKSIPTLPTITGNSTYCTGDSIVLNSDVKKNITWNTGETSPSITIKTAGLYVVTALDPTSGCKEEKSKFITQNPMPDFSFFPAGVYSICGNQEITFQALANYPYYQWYRNGQKLRSSNSSLYPDKNGKYTLQIKTDLGCIGNSDTLRITSLDCPCLVTNNNDAGDGSFREAITCSNTKVGKDLIKFVIPGTGPFTITPVTPLPVITDSVIINGFSQAGKGKYHIVLDGINVLTGLEIKKGISNSQISGLSFKNFSNAIFLNLSVKNTLISNNIINDNANIAICLQGASNNQIDSNQINKSWQGIGVFNKSQNNRITNNQISQIDQNGISVFNGSSGNHISSNNITNTTLSGIYLNIDSDFNSVDSNSLTLNKSHGIVVKNSSNNKITANYVGTDPANADLGNAGLGVLIQDNSNHNTVVLNHILFNDSSNIGVRLNSDFNYFNQNIVGFTNAIGINLNLNASFGNQQIQTPDILGFNLLGDSVELYASAVGQTIQLFSGDGGKDNALAYIKTGSIKLNKTWTLRLAKSYFQNQTDYYFLITTTDGLFNTSQLSNVFKYKPCLVTKLNTNPTISSPICLGNKAILEIANSYKDQNYQVFEKNKSLTNAVPGNDGLLSIDVLGLSGGNHTLTVQVSMLGCLSDSLDQHPMVTVNTIPSSAIQVGTNGPVCAGNPAEFYILKPELGKKYQIFNNLAAVSQPESGNSDTLKIKLENLAPGTYSLTAIASTGGCTSVNLNDKGLITINSIPKTDLNGLVSGPVCLGNAALVTILNAELDKFYQVFEKGKALSQSGIGRDDSLKLVVNTSILPVGIHNLAVAISVAGCKADTLTSRLQLAINSLPDSLTSVLSDTVICIGNEAKITIPNPAKNVVYSLNEGLNNLQQKFGNGSVLEFFVHPTSPGIYFYNLNARITGCKVVNLDAKPEIKVNKQADLSLNVMEDSPVCAGDSSLIKFLSNATIPSYQLFEGQIPVSLTKSAQGEIVFLLKKLTEGTHIYKTHVTVPGCGTEELNDYSVVVVNSSANLNAILFSDTVCSTDQQVDIKMASSEKGIAFNLFINNRPSGSPVIGTGSDIVFPILGSDLNKGYNKISFTASVAGCRLVRITDSTNIVLNQQPDQGLSILGDTVCINSDSASISILSPNRGVSYQAYLNNSKIGLSQTGRNGDIVLKIPVTDLTSDANLVSIRVGINGCSSSYLNNKAIVIVNKIPDANLKVKGAVVCETDSVASITLFKAENQTEYQLYSGINKIGISAIGKGQDLLLFVPTVGMVKNALNKFQIVANIKGCDKKTLDSPAIIKVNLIPDLIASNITGSSVCRSQNANISITNTNPEYNYSIIVNGNILSTIIKGNSGSLISNTPANFLNLDINLIGFSASSEGCQNVTSDKLDTVFRLNVKGIDIFGKSLLCAHDSSSYTVSKIQGAKGYFWAITNGFILNGQNSQQVNVKAIKTDIVLKSVPVGDQGRCDADSVLKRIRVEEKMSGIGTLQAKDTLCALSIDTFLLRGISGASRYIWDWPTDISHHLVSGDSSSQYYQAQYFEAGVKTISVTPYSNCAGESGKTITKQVVIMENAIAEANDYLVQFNLKPLTLNGNGSSVNSPLNKIDRFDYKWYTDISAMATVINANTLNSAILNPTLEETKVYLKVSNQDGRCAALDSAILICDSKLRIPNTFTPNNDGTHDTWEIINLNTLYPDAEVEVFNKWGSVIWKSDIGYTVPWDGKRSGEDLPTATYYYVIALKNGAKPYVGSVTLIK